MPEGADGSMKKNSQLGFTSCAQPPMSDGPPHIDPRLAAMAFPLRNVVGRLHGGRQADSGETDLQGALP